jgi:SanA protein
MKTKNKVMTVVSLSLILVAVIGADGLIRTTTQGRTYSEISLMPYRKVGVLLGCSRCLPDGKSNLFFSYRVAAAAQLFKAHKIDYLIVSGDNQKVGYDEATDMKQALINANVPTERIYCDFAGFRTLDSIVRAKDVFLQNRITVISQEFHNQRAIYIAGHQGIDALGFNARDVDSCHSLRTRFREKLARVKTVLDVYVLGTQPQFRGPIIEIGDRPQR